MAAIQRQQQGGADEIVITDVHSLTGQEDVHNEETGANEYESDKEKGNLENKSDTEKPEGTGKSDQEKENLENISGTDKGTGKSDQEKENISDTKKVQEKVTKKRKTWKTFVIRKKVQEWGMYITSASTKIANKAEPTLALKPRGDITRNPKQGYQWPQKRTCVRKKLGKKKVQEKVSKKKKTWKTKVIW